MSCTNNTSIDLNTQYGNITTEKVGTTTFPDLHINLNWKTQNEYIIPKPGMHNLPKISETPQNSRHWIGARKQVP
jgi:hypothetical protein